LRLPFGDVTSTVQIIAHRGASSAERENTVAAFHRAAAMRADAVELDVRVAADGALVVHHDPALDDGVRVASLPRAELPAHVPTLAEALDACAGMWVNVEIKNSPGDPDFDPDAKVADATVALLRERGDTDRYLISCFDIATLDRCRGLAPEIATAFLSVDAPDGIAATLASRGHRAFHPWHPIVTPDLVEECHAAGVDVNVWTCDDPERMAELIAWGVDGICTNLPDLALDVRNSA